MHGTLKPGPNLLLLLLWLAVLCVALVFSQPKPLLLGCVAAALGAVAGLLQSRAIAATASQLASATTALQVRRVLRSNQSGKYSFYLLWAFAVVLLGLSFGLQTGNPGFSVAAGYSAFALAREAVALPALLRLASHSAQRGL